MAENEGYSDDTYEVEQGYLTHVDPSGRKKKLGPGDRFRPKKRQVEGNTLANKARLVDRDTSTEHTVPADIGIRALPMTDAALELALEADLSEEDFEEVEPEGADGDYLKSQVRELAEG